MSELDSTVEYRPIKNFPGYCVGNDGSVWSFRTKWKLLKQRKIKFGYLAIQLSNKIRKQCFLVHRLVLEAFIGQCPEGMESCHNDSNPSNCRLDNLRWDTPRNNWADRVKRGTDIRGKRNPMAKLDWGKIDKVRQMISNGERCIDIAKKFCVNPETIRRIKRKGGWWYEDRADPGTI